MKNFAFFFFIPSFISIFVLNFIFDGVGRTLLHIFERAMCFFFCSFIPSFFKLPPISIIDISIGFGADFHASDVFFLLLKTDWKERKAKERKKRKRSSYFIVFHLPPLLVCWRWREQFTSTNWSIIIRNEKNAIAIDAATMG